MAVTFNPQVKMASAISFKKKEDTAAASTPVNTPAVVEKQPEAPKKGGLANFASKVSYAWINATGMTKGLVSGLFAGAAAGTAVAGTDWLISGIKKAVKGATLEDTLLKSKFGRFTDGIKNMFKHPTSVLGKTGKVVAPIVAGIILIGNLVSARLKVNKKTADVDHQLYTNHRTEKK